MRRFAAALTNLTIIPAPGYRFAELDLETCKPFIPLVGLLVGGILYGLAQLGQLVMPIPLLAILLALCPVLLTRGFHLDGLADSADAFMSSRSRERMLEIMRDSHIGTMGVFAIVAVLGTNVAALYSLPVNSIAGAMLLAAVGGRCSLVDYICFSRYVRPSGMGQVIFRRQSAWTAVWATLFMTVTGRLILGMPGFYAAAAAVVFSIGWHWYTKRKIGGATGDTIGACEVLSEAVILAVLAVTIDLELNIY